MKFSKVAISRPITTIMFMLIVVVIGIVSYTRLPLDLFPQMNIPYAIVTTTYDGAGPSEIESLVTKPLEQIMGTVSNIKKVSSISSSEQSTVVLEFVDNTDMDMAALDVREKIDLIKPMLPDGVSSPTVFKIDPNAQAIMEIGLTGDYDLVELKQIIDNSIINRIERISGVASVTAYGAMEEEIKITMLPEKMNGFGISTAQIAQLLRIENLNLPVGTADYGNQTLQVRAVGEFKSIDEIENLPIQTAMGTVYLRDIAHITKDYKEMSSYAYINGTPSISLSIEKQSTANTVEVSKKIKEELSTLEKDFPDIDFRILLDNSKTIQDSVDSVVNSALLGAVFALLILYVFLRNFRSTIIIGTAIPVSIIFSFVFMYFFDLSLNIVSLGGLTMGIGMLVDNSIVVLENIFRHREDGLSRAEAAYVGVKEVGIAVIASTFTTIAVFLPLVFVEGMMVSMFRDMSLTITFSLLASLIVALTVVPMMASKLLKLEKRVEGAKKKASTRILDAWGNALDRIDVLYRKILGWSIRKRKTTLLIAILVFIITLVLGGMNGMELMPSAEEGSFVINVSVPQGTAVEKTFEVVDQITAEVNKLSETKNIYVTVQNSINNRAIMSGSAGNSSTITVDVGSRKERSKAVKEIMDEVRARLNNKVVGAELSYQASEMSMPVGKPVSILVSGNEYEILQKISDDFIAIVEGVEGTREVASSLSEGIMEAQIYIDRNKASVYGLSMQTIAGTLQNAVTGKIATTYKIDGTEIDVRVLYDPSRVEYMKDISNVSIPVQTGGSVTLGDVGTVVIKKAPASINRENNKRIISIEAELFGIDTKTANDQIAKKLEAYNMPNGYTYSIGGEMKDLMETFNSLLLAIVAAILLVYMVLAAQFESLLHPFTIMFSIPLSITGAILALVITGNPISMPALIGLLMLVGIVVNNAIVLVDYINQLRGRGYSRDEAILEAGPTRLRPILMTMLTTVLALVPMSFGLGEGTDIMAPMAISVIGGLLLSTFTTLVIIPVIYSVFDSLSSRSRRAKRATA